MNHGKTYRLIQAFLSSNNGSMSILCSDKKGANALAKQVRQMVGEFAICKVSGSTRLGQPIFEVEEDMDGNIYSKVIPNDQIDWAVLIEKSKEVGE